MRWRAAAVALLMTVQPLSVPVGAILSAPAASAPLAVTATVAAITLAPAEAEARAGSSSRSSGGYSRPSRTPSIGGSSGGYTRPSAPRTPSTGSSGGGWFSGGPSSSSGGYARPGNSAPSVAPPPSSAGDRTFRIWASSASWGSIFFQYPSENASFAFSNSG